MFYLGVLHSVQLAPVFGAAVVLNVVRSVVPTTKVQVALQETSPWSSSRRVGLAVFGTGIPARLGLDYTAEARLVPQRCALCPVVGKNRIARRWPEEATSKVQLIIHSRRRI